MAPEQMSPGMTDQEPGMGAPGEAAEGAGYTIEIHVAGTGELTVAVETDGQEGMEAPGAPPAPAAAAQPAKDIKEALTMALGAFKNNGQLADMQAQDDQFEQGFASGPQSAQI